MTTAADDSAVEEAFAAFLAGKPVPEEGATLAAFAGAVRATATLPGRPNAALAELLATGLLVDQPPLSARTAKRRRRRMWFFSAILAKIASAGAIAQAATGAGIVLVGFTGVGAAGALPTPIQHGFTSVVSAITPVADPTTPANGTPAGDSSASTAPSSSTVPSSSAAAPTDAASSDSSAASTPPESSDAPTSTAPKNFGQVVSSLAHERNAARESAHQHGSDAAEATSTEAHSTESEAPETESGDHSAQHSTDGQHSGSSDKSGRSDH